RRRHIARIAVCACGFEDPQDTPLGERMSGSEIQAQLLENLLDGTLLRRPSWAPMAEALLVALLGALLIRGMTRLTPARVAALLHASLAVLALSAFALYRT